MSLLAESVLSFASGLSGTFRDMLGVEFASDPTSVCESKFTPEKGMTVMIHFTGGIQGEFALALSEETAARLIGAWSEGMSGKDLRDLRGDFGGFLKESLNTAVGQAIPALEKQFDALTFLPPVVVYGELEYPDVPAGRVRVFGEAGDIDCFVVLNLVGIELGERLQAALQALGESVREATQAKRSVTSMLDAFPAGLVTVDRNGRIRPGFARLTPEIVGLDRTSSIPGLHVVDLLGLDPTLVESADRWLEVVYDRWGAIPFKDIAGLCPISETENVRGIVVHPEWVPLCADDGSLDGMLLIVEDVTEKRRIEVEIKRLSRLHEESVELVTQIVNLEPDEVQNFVYDSSGLLREAEKIVQGADRNRQFIESLYRTVHTLKGNSGQFQFKGLQQLALEIENDLSQLRLQVEWDDSDTDAEGVAKIQKGIQAAENYVRRLEDMRGKLGHKDEDLGDKANRAIPTVMASLSEIESVAASVWGVHEAGRSLGWPSSTLSLLASAASSAASLREVEFARLGHAIQSVFAKVAQRLGKMVNFSQVGNGPVDIEIHRVLHRCLVYLVNNTLDHGVEKPQDRSAAGKLETALVVLEYARSRDHVEISLSDDGEGVDLQVLRQKAIETGLMDAQQADSAAPPELFDLMFRSGFSIREKVGEFSGRGIGLDMVRDMVQSLGGSIRLESVAGRGSTFKIRIPISVAVPSTRFCIEVNG